VREEIVRVRDLVKRFPVQRGILSGFLSSEARAVHAVDGVSFVISKGEVLGLVGESGSGKTTTGRLILGLTRPSAGEISYRGRPLASFGRAEMERLRTRMQVIFQDPYASLSPRMTVGDAVSHPLKIHGMASGERAREMAEEIMEKVGLTPAGFLYRKYPHQLSGGQRQRVAIARALVTSPDFVVADEPIAMADVSVRAMILELMVRLKEDFDLTYLFITHDLATCKYICDRIAVMYLGRIVEIGPIREVFSNPVHPYTRTLLEAVPVPDPEFRRTQPMPKGEIPNPVDPPAGCAFHPRCAYAEPACARERPELLPVGPGHEAACPVMAR